MTHPLSIFFAILILIPGLLIPVHIMSRLAEVLKSERRGKVEKIFAGGAIIVMLILMVLAAYAAKEFYRIINTWASPIRQ